MNRGGPHIVLGVILIAGGLGLTYAMDGQVLWWGAVVGGVIELLRGIVMVARAPKLDE